MGGDCDVGSAADGGGNTGKMKRKSRLPISQRFFPTLFTASPLNITLYKLDAGIAFLVLSSTNYFL